ncbi:MAG: nitroreductase family protein [Anaerolineae bacterium]
MDLVTVDKLLTTTHSVRKRLDFTRPVEPEALETCISIATHAPSGSNRQDWSFVVVTDVEKKKAVAELYRKSWYAYATARPSESAFVREHPNAAAQMGRIASSAQYLADHMGEAPALVIPCIEGRTDNAPVMMQAAVFGSILPAAWSLMLALRARGLGSAWTTLHLRYEQETADILGIPYDRVMQTALLPVAYYTGADFKPTERLPAGPRTFWDTWGKTR